MPGKEITSFNWMQQGPSALVGPSRRGGEAACPCAEEPMRSSARTLCCPSAPLAKLLLVVNLAIILSGSLAASCKMFLQAHHLPLCGCLSFKLSPAELCSA